MALIILNYLPAVYIVRYALENYIGDAIEEAEDIKVAQEVEARIDAGQEALSDWETFKAELDGLQD